MDIPLQPSPFAKELRKIPAGPAPEVEIPDYGKEIVKTPLGGGFTLYSTKNTENERFRLRFVFPAGTYNDPLLGLAMGYAEMADTETRPQSDFNMELYKLALDLNFYCGKLESAVTISGLQRNLPRALELLSERITKMKSDPAVWRKLTDRIEKARENARKNPSSLMAASTNYALYGADNPFRNELPMETIRGIKADELTEMLRNLPNCPHDVVYYGPGDPAEVAKLVEKNFKPDTDAIRKSAFRPRRDFKIKPAPENTVYKVNIPGNTQIQVQLIRTDEIAVPGNTVRERMLSRYAGQLAFSELREKQSLGYLAGAWYSIPGILPDNYSYFGVILGTQADKLENGLRAMLNFADSMPRDRNLFLASKANVLGILRSARTKKEFLYDAEKTLLRMKQPLDSRLRDCRAIEAMTPEAFFSDAEKHMKNGRNILVLSGDLKSIRPGLLEQFGCVVELTPDMIFVK